MAEGFPLPDWFIGDGSYFGLEKVSLLEEYEDRLVIDWGKATRAWHQRALLEKEIINNREKYDNRHTAQLQYMQYTLLWTFWMENTMSAQHMVGMDCCKDGPIMQLQNTATI